MLELPTIDARAQGPAAIEKFIRGLLDGTRTVFVNVPSWNFAEQQTYVVDRDVAAGDGIETDCTWFNPTDNYVLPGPLTTDEMCGDGLIVWPGQTAAWKGPCQ